VLKRHYTKPIQMLHQRCLTLFLLFSITTQSNAQNVASLLGRWSGKIEKEKTWSVGVDFYMNENGVEALISYPEYGLYDYLADSLVITDTSVKIFFNDRSSPFEFNGIRGKKNISGTWKGLGQVARFSLLRYEKNYFGLRAIPVSFNNGDAKLKGTLVLPQKIRGPYPAVVQVHGSGNQTRTEDFYRSRAYLLAKNGIAVLIYDRRGRGESSGEAVTMDLLAEDAIAGVKFLQTNEWIDKSKIGIMGFSQGGYVAPLAASMNKDISFIICGAAPSITPNEQNDFNATNRLKRRKLPQDSINYVMELRNQVSKYQFSGEGDKSKLESDLGNLKKMGWFSQTLLPSPPLTRYDQPIVDFLNFDPIPFWSKLTIPTLLLWGEMDELVPAEKSKKEIVTALEHAGNKNVEARIFKNAGHGLALNSTEGWDWPRLAENYHSLLVSWIKHQ